MDPMEKKLRTWDLIIRGGLGILVAGVVSVVGFKMENVRVDVAQRAESNRVMIAENNKALLALKDASVKQKEMDMDLGIKMFQTLLTNYLQTSASQEGSARRHQQMLLLNLISLNFQDSPINIKPLFEELDRQAADGAEKQHLREIAMEVARRQAFRLTFLNGVDSGPIEVTEGTILPIANTLAKFKIDKIGKDQIKALLISEATMEKRSLGPFSVGYFDMPLIDNTKLGDMRVSLLLLENDGKTAKVRAIKFDSYLAPDRFDIKELTRSIQANDAGTQIYQEPSKAGP